MKTQAITKLDSLLIRRQELIDTLEWAESYHDSKPLRDELKTVDKSISELGGNYACHIRNKW